MFLFLSFRDWIQTILLKFFSWYDFFFTPTSTTTDSVITNEIITYPLKASPKVSPKMYVSFEIIALTYI
ncbi:hypothetical protein RDI58_012643 [Solanum bulbocastanum]|uniref:Uncharacterized protein n=1 Tax=Solanum bulbocastanum TaxID=147425 RepID=A0AAN8YDB3_SOLBU